MTTTTDRPEPCREMLLSDFLREVYIPIKLLGKSRNSVKTYANAVSAFRRSIGRPPMLGDLNDHCIATALSAIGNHGAAPATVNGIRGCLQAIGSYAAKKRFLDEAPSVPKVPEDEPETTAYTPQELAIILRVAMAETGFYKGVLWSDFWRCLILLLWFTGVRISAMLGLRFSEVDFAQGKVTIRGRYQKNKRTQTFILRPEVMEAIRAIAAPPRERVFCGAPVNRLRSAFSLILRQAGLSAGPRDKFHRVRRSFGQQIDAAGGDACRYLGHSSRAITERSYTGVKPLDCRILPAVQSAPVVEKPKFVYKPKTFFGQVRCAGFVGS